LSNHQIKLDARHDAQTTVKKQ